MDEKYGKEIYEITNKINLLDISYKKEIGDADCDDFNDFDEEEKKETLLFLFNEIENKKEPDEDIINALKEIIKDEKMKQIYLSFKPKKLSFLS
jgi:hypothetical protein